MASEINLRVILHRRLRKAFVPLGDKLGGGFMGRVRLKVTWNEDVRGVENPLKRSLVLLAVKREMTESFGEEN